MILVGFPDIVGGMPLLEIVCILFLLAGCGSKVYSRMADRLQPYPNSLTGSFVAESQDIN
jgi:hypothetical protein